jgi:HD superfamily phosphohydrolase
MLVVRDPVHGLISLSDFEEALLRTPQLQRLRGIRQLAMAHFVYPGANHTRFEHSIGTMYVAGRIAECLGLCREEIVLVRAAGLLHDVGHPAFSHAVEAVLRRNPEYRPLIGGRVFSAHEDFTRFVIQEILSEDEGVLRAAPDDSADFFRELASLAVGESAGGAPYLAQVISGDIDADRIDFLMRDSYHTGVSLGLIDVNQILGSLVLEGDNIVLGGGDGYAEDMALIAAESLLTARAHHYSAIVHNPVTQAARAMLLYALEGSLSRARERMRGLEGRDGFGGVVVDFFLNSDDADLLSFIRSFGGGKELKLLARLREGRICPLGVRFNYSHLHPRTRTALAIISEHGRYKRLFEETLAKKISDEWGGSALVDLDFASGLPKSIRVKTDGEEGFFYDRSALANGLIRAISRQVSLCIFTGGDQKPISQEDLLLEIDRLSEKLVHFIRGESWIQLEGLILLFHCANSVFMEQTDSYLLVPKIHNITWIYRTSYQLSKIPALKPLFEYSYTTELGFPYSDSLYRNIQTLVAMDMLNEDIRSIERKGVWKQRYEYMLTPTGADYARRIESFYRGEIQHITEHLRSNKHSIVRDLIKMPKRRYST